MSTTSGPPPTPARGRGRLARLDTFSSLQRNPNFRLYWAGACTSNIGTWMQTVAQGWLVYVLTNSPFLLGVVSFAGAIPVLLFSLFGGVLADRFERRRLMVWTQTGMMILAFALWLLTILNVVTVWEIALIAFLNGIVMALNTPVRQSIISDLVPREDLQNAIAVNSMQFQTSRILGPALAGLALAVIGPGWCFFLNALSFLAVIAALLIMDVPPLLPRKHPSVWKNMTEGIDYVWKQPIIFALLVVAAVPSLFGQVYQPMMPAIAISVLHVDATGLGLLQSAAGAGALLGAMAIASLTKNQHRGRIMLAALLLFGIALILFGLSLQMLLALAFVFVVGFASMAYSALNQTFLQTLADEELRGRVLSLLTLTTFGFQPLGALLAGVVAERAGVGTALVIGGIICIATIAVVQIKRPQLAALA